MYTEKSSLLCYFMHWVFDNFLLADEPFPKALRSHETCVLVNNNWCGKLFSSLESPTTFDENFKGNSVLFFYSWFQFVKLGIRQFYI